MSPLFGTDPNRILERGEPVQGRLVGIEVKTTGDEHTVRYEEYAVEANGTTYGIRQELVGPPDVRLGMPLALRVEGSNVVIEWDGAGAQNWKMLRKPPAPGITDDHDDNNNRGVLTKARKGGRKVHATLLALESRSVAMGLGSTVDGRMRIDPVDGEPYEITVQNVSRVPGYAAHLPVVGATLPGWEIKTLMRGERVMIDWPAAAMADPGIGRPTAEMPAGAGLFGGGALGGAASAGATTMGSASDVPGAETDWTATEPPEIPDYAKNLMKKFGVDPESLK